MNNDQNSPQDQDQDINEHRRTQQQVANDGSAAPRPENAHGAGVQQQGGKSLMSSPDSEGTHGGNRGGDQHAGPTSAKGSSNRGGQPGTDQKNDGGGADAQEADQTKNTTAYNTEYTNGRSASSSANDGGKMGDEDNPA